MNVTIKEDRIEISEPRDSVVSYVAFVIAGSFLLAGAATLGVLGLLAIVPTDLLPVGAPMILFGFLLLLTGQRRLRQTYATSIVFDRVAGRVSYFHSRVKQELTIPFGEVRRVTAHGRRESSYSVGDTTTARTRVVWPIVLELIDGSSFWIGTHSTREETADLVTAITSLTGHPGQIDDEVLSPGDPARLSKHASAVSGFSGSHSANLHAKRVGETEAFTISRTYTVSDAVVLLIVALLMLTVALAASGLLSSSGISLNGFRPLGAVAGLVPLGIVLLLIFLLARRYRIVLRPDGLLVELHFRPGYRRPSRTIELPVESIRSVRLDRLEMGAFRLAVGVDYTVKIPRVSAFLANVGAFRKNNVTEVRGEQIIRLFEIQPWGTPPFGADFQDLRYLERRIEQRYRLQEDS